MYVAYTKLKIEVCWSLLAGIIFSMMPDLLAGDFRLGRWFYYFSDFTFWGKEQSMFLFGSISAFFVIQSIKKYKEAND